MKKLTILSSFILLVAALSCGQSIQITCPTAAVNGSAFCPAPSSLQVSAQPTTITVKSSSILKALAFPGGQDVTQQCNPWASSDNTILAVNGNIATGVSAGTATASCTIGGLTVPTTIAISVSTIVFTNPVQATCASPCVIPGGSNGVAYSYTFAATSSAGGPYTWTVSTGSFSACGVTLASTGVLSGTATTAVCTPTVQVSDGASNTKTLQVSLTVAAAGSCGPPTYSCSSTSSAVVQTPNTPPFTGSTGYNGIAYDTSLNASGIDPILRATDSTMISGHTPVSTPSGGDNDEVWSCTGRTDTSGDCSGASLYLLESYYGGAPFVMGIQIIGGLPTVVAPLPPSSSSTRPSPGGDISFSNQNHLVGYRTITSSGDPQIWKTTYAWDGTVGHVLTFTDALFYDIGANCAIPNGTSFNSAWTSPVSHDINDQVFNVALSNNNGIRAGVDTISVTNGSVAFTISGPTPLRTDGGFVNAVIKINNVGYVIASVTSTTTGTLTIPYAGTTGSGIAFNVPGGQGTGFYIASYNSTGPYCYVLNVFSGTTTCSGTGCPATGTLDNGCHNMYIHDGFMFRDGIYGQWSGATSGINCGNTSLFWQTNSTHAVACTGTISGDGNLCAGHNTFGYHNEVAISNPLFVNFNPASAASVTPFASFGSLPPAGAGTGGNCENHFSWRNAKSGDTQPIIGSSAQANYLSSSTTSSWTAPSQNENYALTQSGTLIRFGHNFILGSSTDTCGANPVGPFDNNFNTYEAIGTVSQDGKLWEWNSSMLGQLGTDADSRVRADIFVQLLQ